MSSLTRRRFLTTATAAAGTLAAAPQRLPNILLLFPDQWRYDWTGFHPGLAVRTPNLERIAKRGTRFTRAVVASPVCAPSRACLAAGKEYDRCRVASNGVDFPLDQTTYYQLLRDRGYHVMACGKMDLNKNSHNQGLDGQRLMREWGFSDMINNAGKYDALNGAETPREPYMAFLHARKLASVHVEDYAKRSAVGGYAATFPTPLPEDAYCDNWLSQNGLDLLRRAPKGKPWHLAVNFTGPHDPEDITARMEATVRGRNFPGPHANTEFSPEIHNAIRQNYTAMCENVDRWVGTYLDEIEKRGETDNTIVVFCSDHGEMLGDHNRWRKSVPYEASVRVPLLVSGPGVRRNQVSDALVSHMDLTATFLDYANTERPPDMDSRTLRPLLEGRSRKHRELVRSGLGTWRSITDGRYKLITGFDPNKRAGQGGRGDDPNAAPLLFDLESDPHEDRNIAEKAQPELKRMMEALRA